MNKSQAQASAKKINQSLMNLSPTALITMFEIDIENLVTDRGLTDIQDNQDNILRFHNNVKLLDTSITWRQYEYFACPIQAQGFELNGRGTLPTPKLAISVSPEGIPALAILKTRMRQLDDLIGAKVTRIRTYAENLDAINFADKDTDVYSTRGEDPTIEPPELPRDVYYIDRKSAENKSSIEFELASILDVEGVKLPARVVYANRCPFTYRCEGCLYEEKERYNALTAAERAKVFGDATVNDLFNPAPAVANERDEKIIDILNPNPGSIDPNIVTNLAAPAKDFNPYSPDKLKSIEIGHTVFITKNSINYYFVARVANPPSDPPNNLYWIADTCSKSVRGCKLRFRKNLGGVEVSMPLRYGGFAGCDKVK